MVLDERITTGYHLAGMVKELLRDPAARAQMGERLRQLFPPAKPEDILEILTELV
jgi:UDP-N-acetylglucosamine:LPS N-acetylglucosamine transferase